MKKALLRNSGYNLIGQGAPLAVALVTIPQLVQTLGTEKFGFLTVVWLLVGYIGVLDLGIGRTLTKMVAERLATKEVEEIPVIVATGSIVLLTIGVVLGVSLAFSASVVVRFMFEIQGEVVGAVSAVRVLAASIPLVVLSSGFRGVLEAHQRFRLVNSIRIPVGALNYVAPLGLAWISPRLDLVVGGLLATRLLACVLYGIAVRRQIGSMSRSGILSWPIAREALHYGSWITVTNVVNPLLVSMDRLMLASFVPLGRVAFYTTPAEMVSKLWVVPNAVLLAVFPAFSGLSRTDPGERASLFIHASAYVAAATLPIALVAILAGRFLLGVWLGPTFASEGGRVLEILAVAFFLNSLAFVPFALLQATGKARAAATFMLAELPLYAMTLVFAITAHGLVGAAYAVLARVTIESIGLMILSAAVIRTSAGRTWRSVLAIATSLLLMLAVVRATAPLSWLLVGTLLIGVLYMLRRVMRSYPMQELTETRPAMSGAAGADIRTRLQSDVEAQ